MSVKRMSAVWDHSRAEGNDRLTLLCLADHADDDGYAFPGQPRIAQKVRCSERSIPRIVERLENLGELYVERGGGAGRKSRYLVLPGLSDEEIGRALHQRFGKSPLEIHAILTTLRERRQAAPASPSSNDDGKKGDTVTGFWGTGKGDSQRKKGDTRRKTLTPAAKKPDTAVSGDSSVDSPNDPPNDPPNERPSRARASNGGFVDKLRLFGEDGYGSGPTDDGAAPEPFQANDDRPRPTPNPLPSDDLLLAELTAWSAALAHPFSERDVLAMAVAARKRHGLTPEALRDLLAEATERAKKPGGYVLTALLQWEPGTAWPSGRPTSRARAQEREAARLQPVDDTEERQFVAWWLAEQRQPPFADAAQRSRYSAWLKAKGEVGDPDRPDFSPHACWRRELAREQL